MLQSWPKPTCIFWKQAGEERSSRVIWHRHALACAKEEPEPAELAACWQPRLWPAAPEAAECYAQAAKVWQLPAHCPQWHLSPW